MSESIRIETIEADGPITKDGKGFALPIAYVLEDGQRIPTHYVRDRKRDVVAFASTLPAAPEHPMDANFRDGRYIGTRTSFYIGPR